MQKILNGKRFAEIGRQDRNLVLTLLHVEKLRRDYRCSFNDSLDLLARVHQKYEHEIECATAVLDVFNEIDEESDDDE